MKTKKYGDIKVSYYWVIKKGIPIKKFYFWNSNEENVFKSPKEVYKFLRVI